MIIAGHSRAAGRLAVDRDLPQGPSGSCSDLVKHVQGSPWLERLERSTQKSYYRARGSATDEVSGDGRAMVGPGLAP